MGWLDLWNKYRAIPSEPMLITSPVQSVDAPVVSSVPTAQVISAGLIDGGELTIASGLITVTNTKHAIDTEADAATDNLAGAYGGSEGRLLFIHPTADARTVVVINTDTSEGVDGTRFWMTDTSNVSLDDLYDGMLFIYRADLDEGAGGWQEVARGAGLVDHGSLLGLEDTDHDAAALTYTPSVFTDWDSDMDPGGVDDALDQLAERVDDVEVVDAAAATGSLRTLGTAATAACAGNDARLSDARTPAAHGPSKHTEGTAWRLTYYNADGDETEIALGADGTFLESNGAAAAPAFRAIVHGDVGVTSMKQSVMLTAGAGRPTTTSGCAAVAVVEAGTNDVDYCVLAFDKDTDEYAFWGPIATPDNWDGGTLTAVFYWSCAAGVGGANKTVCWSIQMIALDNDDAIDRAWGTAVTVTDTWIADADIHESAASDAITPATTVSREGGDLLFVRVMRDVSGDDLAGDARLIAVKLEFGVTALSA